MRDEQIAAIERVVDEMVAGFARRDVEGIVSLFAPDATIESYMVNRIFNREDGVCRGHAEIRELITALTKRGKPWGAHGPPLVKGNLAVVEYTSATSNAETFSVDVIEVREGKIASLRAYAGWRAVAHVIEESRR